MRRIPPLVETAWLPLVMVALLVIYLPGLDNSPVFDDGYLADGQLFADYRSGLHPGVRWLSYSSFVWIHDLLGEGWWKQRTFNLLLHMGVVLGLWALYREVLKHVTAPAAAPGEAQPVAYYQSPALG